MIYVDESGERKSNICTFLLFELYTFIIIFAIMSERAVLFHERETVEAYTR